MANFFYPKLKLLFIHIPKTGGMSIRDPNNGILSEYKHLRTHTFVPRSWKSNHSFAVVRNPYDRFLSGVGYVRRRWHPDITIEECLDMVEANGIDKNIPLTPEGLPLLHLIPMTHPFNNIWEAKTIIKYENYEEEINKFLEPIVPNFKGIPKLNTATKTKPKRYFDMETKLRIDRIFHKDFCEFNYYEEIF